MKKLVSVLLAGAVAASLAGCEGVGEKQAGGAVLGGAAGGLIGSQFGGGAGAVAATAAGALLGLFVGSETGKSLDRADQLHAAETTQAALDGNQAGTASTWIDPDSTHSGTVTPVRTFRTPQGQYCREFQQTVTIEGRTEQAYGTACRQPDGTWKIVDR
jgi:surface antigen